MSQRHPQTIGMAPHIEALPPQMALYMLNGLACVQKQLRSPLQVSDLKNGMVLVPFRVHVILPVVDQCLE